MPNIEDSQNIVEVKDISFSYGDNEILKDISFAVPKGDYLGIIGPNGAGKTTLLKIMLGLLRPAKGSINLFGKDVKEFKDWSKIGYVPQKATNFDVGFPATVHEVVLMGRYARVGLTRRVTEEDHRKAMHALDQVEMSALHNRLIGELSGGQQQRVFIARALATEPEIIFLDEPTVSVDEQARNDFYSLLKKLNKDEGLTLVLISHDVEMVMKEVKHIACVDKILICHNLPEEFIRKTELSQPLRGEVRIITHRHKSQ